MKLLNTITLGLLATTTLGLAETTMCFKENHKSMATIENTKLDGGLCGSSKTVNEMKNDGWNIDDIKISQANGAMNFIYIFKRGASNYVASTTSAPTTESSEAMEARILAKLEKKKEEEEKTKKIVEQKNMADEGQKYYVNKCQVCHGDKGELEARGYSRPLKDLSVDEMKDSISGYTNGNYDRGMAILMQPISNGISHRDLEKVHAYLKKINK